MGFKSQSAWRFRPRLLTVSVLIVIGAIIVLANLTEEIGIHGADVVTAHGRLQFALPFGGPVDPLFRGIGVWSVSYGWPFLWRQYVLNNAFHQLPYGVLGECYSLARLMLNLAIWLIIVVGSGGACDWMLRRYEPHFRWSLRAMLMATALAAAFLAWFVGARDRANLQDAVIAAKPCKRLWLKRRGPKWFGLIGAGRYLQKVVGAEVDLTPETTWEGELYEADLKRNTDLLATLGRLRDLQYLFVVGESLRPEMVDAISRARQLRVLSISVGGYGRRFSQEDLRISNECLEAIGTMHGLEHLSLVGMPVASESLACLGGLTNLKSLSLDVERNEAAPEARLLSRLPPLPWLEVVDLGGSYVGHRGLRYLSVLPKLKFLYLNYTHIAEYPSADSPFSEFDAGIAELAGLKFLEEIVVRGDMASAPALRSLVALKQVKRLRIGGPYRSDPMDALVLDHGDEVGVPRAEIDEYRRALDALREANPGIVIDGDKVSLESPEEPLVPGRYETLPEEVGRQWVRSSLSEWKSRTPLPR